MGIISPTLPTLGGDNATEDADVLDTLQALLDLVNGSLDDANIADDSLSGTKLLLSAAAAPYLKLATKVDRTIRWGTGSITNTSINGGQSQGNVAVAHSLGKIPEFALAVAATTVTVGGIGYVPAMNVEAINSTSLGIRAQIMAASTATIGFYWVAIG